MEGLRATSEGLSNLMSTKMIGFAIVGLLSIIVVNVLFYRELKKTFKDRKMIWYGLNMHEEGRKDCLSVYIINSKCCSYLPPTTNASPSITWRRTKSTSRTSSATAPSMISPPTSPRIRTRASFTSAPRPSSSSPIIRTSHSSSSSSSPWRRFPLSVSHISHSCRIHQVYDLAHHHYQSAGKQSSGAFPYLRGPERADQYDIGDSAIFPSY